MPADMAQVFSVIPRAAALDARRVQPDWIVGIAALTGAVLMGMAIALVPLLASITHLSAPVIIALVLFVAALPVLLAHWRLALAVFLLWLTIEDLMRKLAGNDIAIYFVKDIFLVCLLVSTWRVPAIRNAWRAATGRARLPLYALAAWAVLLSIPSVSTSWQLPLVGLRLDFLYLPLTAVGFLLAPDRRRLRSGLWIMAGVGVLACAIGLVQAIVGPSFLSPSVATPGLIHLVLVRGGAGAAAVYRPTGTFVDPARYLSMALVTLAVALSLAAISRGQARALAIGGAGLAALSIWTSGGRAGLIEGAVLTLVALTTASSASRTVRRSILVALGGAALAAALWFFLPSLFDSRLTWYTTTLIPGAPQGEWAFRLSSYSKSTLTGLQQGGLIGRGTGTESLGKQYLLGGTDYSVIGLYTVEGGFAGVASEWGAIGLTFWLAWTLAWFGRQLRSVLSAPMSDNRAAGRVLVTWMAFFLFIAFFSGLAEFQNYVANAYFWLLSGIIFALPAIREAEPA